MPKIVRYSTKLGLKKKEMRDVRRIVSTTSPSSCCKPAVIKESSRPSQVFRLQDRQGLLLLALRF